MWPYAVEKSKFENINRDRIVVLFTSMLSVVLYSDYKVYLQ